MYSHPHTHLAISHERHEDMLREARKSELARLVQHERPGLVTRLRGLFGHRVKHQPAVPRPLAS
jgi:hypothetical protein